MNLEELHSEVRASLGRGATLDAAIPLYVAMAATFLERNHTFMYMECFGELSVDYMAEQPRVIALPSARVKAVRFIRRVKDDGGFVYLRPVEARDVTAVAEGMPTGFWRSGDRYVVLDNTPTENLSLEIQWHEFTAWPKDLAAEPWLAMRGPDVLMAQTMILLSPRLRDLQLRETYIPVRNEGLKTLLNTDDEARFQGMSEAIQFSQERYP